MVTSVPIAASVRIGISLRLAGLLRLPQGGDNRAIERVSALGSAGNMIQYRALALGDLRRQCGDHGTGIASVALGDDGGCDAAALDGYLRLDIAVPRKAP